MAHAGGRDHRAGRKTIRVGRLHENPRNGSGRRGCRVVGTAADPRCYWRGKARLRCITEFVSQTNLREIQEKLRTRDVHGYRLAFPFATLCQPRGEACGKTFRSEAETGFDLTIRDRKGVVKVGGVGKIAHAELRSEERRVGKECRSRCSPD